ncbi:MAG TPA: DUF445 domain-containing protein [Acidimicrobiales bacterium]|jgi:uncharacterized membrane-anchored protein YjiN (DUF445 family)
MALTGTVPGLRSAQLKEQQLAIMKRRATALLGAVTLVFLALTLWGGETTLAGYAQAMAEASMVGGLADWFAVTALFRHPLGIPIPHTAIVVERKRQFGETLGEFIQETFLTREVVLERMRGAGVVKRAADWLCQPASADRLARHVLDGAVALADLVRDEDVHAAIDGVVRTRIEETPLAPLAGRALRFVTEDGRHDEVVDAALHGLDHYLDEHREEFRARLAAQSPWWLPGAVEDRIFERMLDGVRSVVDDMVKNPDHDLRRQLDARLAQFASDLETSPELRARGEQIKHDVLAQPELRAWTASVWTDLKAALRLQAADPDSQLRRKLADSFRTAGARMQDDPVLAGKAQDAIEEAVGYVVDHFNGEIATLVSGTIDRWDAEETSRRLELLLGPDLQYIRINGTVVGGLAGLLLHFVAITIH